MKIVISLSIFLCTFSPSANALDLASQGNRLLTTVYDLQRDQFAQAYDDIKKGKNVSIKHLKEYPLYPYLEYEQLNRRMGSASNKELLNFIARHENTRVAELVWNVWMGRMVRAKQWDNIKKAYSPLAAGTEVKCHYLNALMHTGEKETAFAEGEKLWMSHKSRPDACDVIFNALKDENRITKAMYWERIELAVDKRNSGLARSLIKFLPDDEQKIAEQFIVADRDPKSALKSKYVGRGKYSRKVIAHAIKRLARKNLQQGQNTWNSYKHRYTFSPAEKGNIESYLAVRAAFNHDSKALAKFKAIPAKFRDDEANVWMARMALRDGDWKALHNAIDAMGEENQNRDIWQYWKARAYTETGDSLAAEKGYRQLSGNATFYGFLSADHLDIPYTVFDNGFKDWKKCSDSARHVPGINRALEWFKLNENGMASREWYWALKHMNKEGILSAAALALDLERPLLAVSTVAKTEDWNQVDLRFPMLYTKLIKELSSKNGVNPAWVYGIMRRESVFNTEAVSGAKAMGLMQLLPSTARHIGKKLGLSSVSKSDLTTPHLNINLGSAYLSEMLDNFDGSYVKATAGYNAGPGRSVKWTPKDKTIEADRWVESIPFTETRKYVRAVMAYTTIYDHKLTSGRGQRISKRLAPVKAK